MLNFISNTAVCSNCLVNYITQLVIKKPYSIIMTDDNTTLYTQPLGRPSCWPKVKGHSIMLHITHNLWEDRAAGQRSKVIL